MPDSLLRVLTCGSVDDGKSTLIGRLLFEYGSVPDDVMAALVRDSRRFGTVENGVDYALLVDGLSAEREQGVTIDVAYRFFETANRRFILADAPGHEQYTRNMATGASTADVAVLLVDARKGLLAQTRRHAAIAWLMGIRQVVLAVNKMDLVDFDQEVFDRIVCDFGGLRDRLGGIPVIAIPVCARDGDNVIRPGDRMGWYAGPSLLAALEAAQPSREAAARAFRMPVQLRQPPRRLVPRLCRHDRRRPASRGRSDRPMQPPRIGARVARIVTMDGDLAEAEAGDAVTLVLDQEIDVSRGDVLADGAGAAGRRRADRLDRLDGRKRRCSAAAPIPLMLGTRSGHRHGHRTVRAAGHRHAGRGADPRPATERDRPGRAVADPAAGLRALCRQPRRSAGSS